MFGRMMRVAGIALKAALVATVGSVVRVAKGQAQSKIERRAQELLKEAAEHYVKVVTLA